MRRQDEKIKAAKSTILLKEIKTRGTEAVMSGKTDIDTYNDYHNIKSIVSYTPLNIDNLKWAVAVKIDQAEAFKPANKLRNLMILILMVAVVAIIIISFVVASSIAKPMIKMAKLL